MSLPRSNKRKSPQQRPKSRSGHNYEEEAFKRSQLALSIKSAVQSLCFRTIQWADKQIHKNLGSGSHKKAVDIGCAYGYVTDLLGQLEYDSVGLDISRYALKTGEKVNRVQGDAQHLPFRSGFADIITCFDTFEHLSQPTLLIQESHRCLRHGGVLIIENPVANPIDVISDRLHKMDEIHCSLLTSRELIFLTRKAGFRIARRGLFPIPFQRFPIFGRFIEIPVPVSVARRMLIVATKNYESEMPNMRKKQN